MDTKICSKCSEIKILSEFRKDITKKDGLRPDCKKCIKEYELSRRNNNPSMMKEKLQKFYQENPHKRKEYRKNYLKRKHQQRKERRNSDPIFNLTNRMRSRIHKYLKSMNIEKKNKTFEILGCTPEFFKNYIENQFREGMSWELFGEFIHIDHIIPLSIAKNEEDLYKLCHYTNLQPLWAFENIKKSNKII